MSATPRPSEQVGAPAAEPRGASHVGPRGASDVGPRGASDVGPRGAFDVVPRGASDVGPRGASAVLPLSGAEEEVMRALGRVMAVLPRTLDADLQRDQRMSLSEYTTLRMLSEADGRRLRMSELAQACDMSLSGMTRLAAKLESQGYLQRIPCANDARGFNAVLTDAGFNRLREVWPDHLASVRRHIFDHLSEVDLCRLARALAKIAEEA